MTSERSKRRDFLSLIFISKSIILCGQKIIHNGEVPLLHVASVDCIYKRYTRISIIIQVKLPKGINNSFMEIIVTYQLLVVLLVHFLIWLLQWQQQTPGMQWSSLLDYAVMVSLKTDSKKFEEQKFPRSS